MRPLESADIVLVQFPFTDLSHTKLRPAVIISQNEVHKKEEDYTLLFISSVIPDHIESYEVFFNNDHPDFKESGLQKSSLFKGNKIATVQKKLLSQRLGKLGPQILREVQAAIHRALVV